jgi:DNA modification methylase
MSSYTCDNCGKKFTKSGLSRHKNIKRPCKKETDSNVTNIPTEQGETSVQTDYFKKTCKELIEICKERSINGYRGKKKNELIQLLIDTPITNENNSNEVSNVESTVSLSLKYNVANAFEFLENDTNSYRCIYLDPPYASGRDYKFAEEDESIVFTDKFTPEKYKEWLSRLISLCKRRLSKDGTLWFHIAAEYSFIPEQVLRSEFKDIEKIFWKKSHGKNTVKNKMGAVIDIIFRCYNATPIFNLQYIPLDSHYFENSYRNKDERGLYALGSLRFDKTRSGNKYEIINDGIAYNANYGWKIRKEEMMRLISEKRIHFVPPNEKREGNLYKKLYKTECKGKPLSNLWDDISYITRTQQDPRTYPTQKPIKLLQRIIAISTNKGDKVLDPTAGSGTTGIACKTLERNCYMIDINENAKKIFEKRLDDLGNSDNNVSSNFVECDSDLSDDSI